MGQNNSKPSTSPKKLEPRSLLKACFRNKIFSFVPFEIWEEIVVDCDAKVIFMISQTCWAFRSLIINAKEKYLQKALKLRIEGDIPLALKCVQFSANCGNSTAMFHLAYGYRYGGFGVKRDIKKATTWLRNASMSGSAAGMAMYLYRLYYYEHGKDLETNLRDSWSQKALSSDDPFATGYCYWFNLGVSFDAVKALKCFEESAEKGNEFGQNYLGLVFFEGKGKIAPSYEKSFYWYMKSAEQGLADSQYRVGFMYKLGQGCEKNIEMATLWMKKAANQKHSDALRCDW